MRNFNEGVTVSGFEQVLNGAGPFTVFAPSDIAFGKLASGVYRELLKPENKVKLTDLLNCHTVAGEIEFSSLKDGDKLQSLNGKELLVSVIGDSVRVNGAIIQSRDAVSSNGIVHSLDAILKN
ncbi:fasciclin domain-containing protein [Filimonas lacunae]|nr:fasciclin domain-containing protein [Filimonas lacunae]